MMDLEFVTRKPPIRHSHSSMSQKSLKILENKIFLGDSEMIGIGESTKNSNSNSNTYNKKKRKRVNCCRLYTLIWVMRAIGSCPLVIDQIKEFDLKVSFQWRSRITVYSGIFGIFRCLVSIVYYKDWGYYMLGRKYTDTIDDWVLLTMNAILPVVLCWNTLSAWIVADKVASISNNWMDIEFHFHKIFNSHYIYSPQLMTWHLISILLVITILFCAILLTVMEVFVLNTIPTVFFPIWLIRISRAFSISFFVLISGLEDFQVILTYFITAEAYVNLRNGIKNQIRKIDQLTHQNVSKWFKILQMIRKNINLIGITQAPEQIFGFLHAILVFTGLSFITIRLFMGETGSDYTNRNFIISALVTFIYSFRLGIKIIFAENIIVEEQKIADLLLESKLEKLDIYGRLEIKKMIDIIQQKPSKIVLNGYMVIEKRLIPKVLGCVATYLVVLIQLHPTYRFNGNIPK